MLAENALTTLSRMKMMLGMPDVYDKRTDELIALLINRASGWIERQTGRHLSQKRYLDWYDADGQQELITDEFPITKVDYVKENGVLVAPSLYNFTQRGDAGVIYKDTGWLKAGYVRGLAYDQIAPKRAIEVSYMAGYVLPQRASRERPQTLPADLEGLVWEIVSQTYTNLQNGSQGLTSFSISDVTWNFDKAQRPEWIQLINLYKRY